MSEEGHEIQSQPKIELPADEGNINSDRKLASYNLTQAKQKKKKNGGGDKSNHLLSLNDYVDKHIISDIEETVNLRGSEGRVRR